jgi:osmotically-inducible protein OsmY
MPTDTSVQEAVLAELRWDPIIASTYIGVAVKDGIVTLTGHVQSLAEKHAVEEAARRVRGVKAIAGEIEVRLPFENVRADDDIAAAIIERLSWDAVVPRDAIKPVVENGWVTLTGEVDWSYQRDAAIRDVSRLYGVVGVTDRITVKRKVNPRSISDDIMHALKRSWFFNPNTIDVTVDEGRVYLRGTVHTPHERQIAASTAWAAPGVTDVVNEIVVA